MTFEEYAAAAKTTAIYPGHRKLEGLNYAVLGLCGESGEVAEKVKKLYRDDRQYDGAFEIELAKELGDVLWYISAVASEIDYPLERIARLNVEKLQSRADRDRLSGDGDNR